MASDWAILDDVVQCEWDDLLAAKGGYPLQTALWGAARYQSDGFSSEYLALRADGRLVLLARVESRPHGIAGKVAWIPQGPVYVDRRLARQAGVELKKELKRRGYQLCFENPYPAGPPQYQEHGAPIGVPTQTSVVNLLAGEGAVWAGLSSKWRNSVRSAQRAGMRVVEARDEKSISEFVQGCERLSLAKGFRYQGTLSLVASLLQGSRPSVSARLFCAQMDNRFRGGVLVMIVGNTMQLMFSSASCGEPSPGRLLQWAAMKLAMNARVAHYDLGGIDPGGNPGVYEFKRQLRGEVVTIPPIRVSALGLRGRLALMGGRVLGKL